MKNICYLYLLLILPYLVKAQAREDYPCRFDSVVVNNHSIEGYLDNISYFPGDTVKLYSHTLEPMFKVQIQRISSWNKYELLQTFDSIAGKAQNYDVCAYKYGCKWSETFRFVIPADWKTGYYCVRLTEPISKKLFTIALVVKNAGVKRPILLLAHNFVWQAYTAWGGASLYEYTVTPNVEKYAHSLFVNFQRPSERAQPTGGSFAMRGEMMLVDWLNANGYEFDLASDADMHRNPHLLDDYKIFVINRNAEYWSEPMYDQLESFLNKGGNLINLSACSVYWKVTISGSEMECRKDYKTHLHNGSPGGRWRTVGRPESRILGVEYTHSGISTFYPYVVSASNHWLLQETNIEAGDTIGKTGMYYAACGGETDKRTQYSPSNMVVLAKGLNKDLDPNYPDQNAGGEMVYYVHPCGGGVFSTGSIAYTNSLKTDSVISRLTKKVFDAFLSGKVMQLAGTSTPIPTILSDGQQLYISNAICSTNLSLYNISGQQLLSTKINNGSIKFPLSAGMYIAHFYNDTTQWTTKLIVK